MNESNVNNVIGNVDNVDTILLQIDKRRRRCGEKGLLQMGKGE